MSTSTLSLFPHTDGPEYHPVCVCGKIEEYCTCKADHARRINATAPSNHTETSKAAAAHVLATGQAATQLAQVLSLIEQAGQEGLTRGDIAHALGLPQSTIAARVDTLRKAGRVQEDGRTRIPKCGGAVRQKVIVGVGK